MHDSSGRRTIAGAIVLDPAAPRSRNGAQDELLLARASHPNDVAVFVSTQIGRDHFAIASSLLSQSRFSKAEIADAVNGFVKSGGMVTTGEIVIDAGWWDELKAQAARFIDREHEIHPEQTGVPHARLKAQFRTLPISQLFEALLADLSRCDFVRAGDLIRRATHRPVLPERLKTAALRIQSALTNSSAPPSPTELTPDPISQHALRFLRDIGSIIELNGEVVLARDQFRKMRDTVIAFLRKNNSAATSELRQLLGTNRRVIIPFLERLDRDGVTRRIADKRVLAKPS
jgi:selenocysteine-specific elongation factor